jgi:MoxR-like ATPase
MSKWIKPARVRQAISALAVWRGNAKSQAAMHLWPLLALVEHGASTGKNIVFTEQDDRVFWDRYFRFIGDTRGPGSSPTFTPNYYVDPLVQQLKPSDYYHRSPASIRDRTFLNAWHAADFNPPTNEWKLKPNFSQILEDKIIKRKGVSYRVPVVDAAIFLFRGDEFADEADASTLEAKFRATFPFAPADYGRLFEFRNESAANIFTDEKPSDEALNDAVREATVNSDKPVIAATQEGDLPLIDDDDKHLVEIKKLLQLGSSGIIFRGCPGTSKTWYAKQIARKLVLDPQKDIFQVQFHPAYGYEDFVEGYRPDPKARSGFGIVDRIFLEAQNRATQISTLVVFIIDEINRGDPARVFGELLTYMEFGYRGAEFSTALSGKRISVPSNLVILGTMNPHDRSTVQFDVALVRRFDHIDLEPDGELVESFLSNTTEHPTGFTSNQASRIAQWFDSMQDILKEVGGIGHTYFKDVKTVEQMETVWRYRVLPYCENVLELDPTRLEHARKSFDQMFAEVAGQQAGA